jgi:hypothetical protein
VDPRAGLDDLEKRKFFILPGLERRTLSRSAHTQWVYRLRYPVCALCALTLGICDLESAVQLVQLRVLGRELSISLVNSED